MPTGASTDRSPLSPDKCHAALAASNPSYTSLSITQKPSWIRPPNSYPPGSVSSLSVAFEDPDGSKLKVLLAEHYLYALSNRASVLKWKYHQKNSKGKSKSNTSEHSSAGDTNDDEDINQLLTNVPTLATPHSFKFSETIPPLAAIHPPSTAPKTTITIPPQSTRSKAQGKK